MSEAVKCDICIYADNLCVVCQHKDINETQKQLYEANKLVRITS